MVDGMNVGCLRAAKLLVNSDVDGFMMLMMLVRSILYFNWNKSHALKEIINV